MRINDKERIEYLYELGKRKNCTNDENTFYYNQFILPYSVEIEYEISDFNKNFNKLNKGELEDLENRKIEEENKILNSFANENYFIKANENVISGQLEDYYFDNYFELFDIERTGFPSEEDPQKKLPKIRVFNYKDDRTELGSKIGKFEFTLKGRGKEWLDSKGAHDVKEMNYKDEENRLNSQLNETDLSAKERKNLENTKIELMKSKLEDDINQERKKLVNKLSRFDYELTKENLSKIHEFYLELEELEKQNPKESKKEKSKDAEEENWLKNKVNKVFTDGDKEESLEEINKKLVGDLLKLSVDIDDLEMRVIRVNTTQLDNDSDRVYKYKMKVLVLLNIAVYKNGLTEKELVDFRKISKIFGRDSLELNQINNAFKQFVGDKFKILYDMDEVDGNYELSINIGNDDEFKIKNVVEHIDNNKNKNQTIAKFDRVKDSISQILRLTCNKFKENKDGSINQDNKDLMLSFEYLNSRRMFSNSTILYSGVNIAEMDYFNLEKMIIEAKHYKEKKEKEKKDVDKDVEEKRFNSDEFVRFTNLDFKESTIQNDLFLSEFIEKYTYPRWTNSGSLYACSPIANLYIANDGSMPFLVSTQHTLYYEMYMLVLTQNLMLCIAHDELLGGKQEIRESGKILENFNDTSNRLMLNRVSSEIQGLELYELYQEGLGVNNLHNNLKEATNAIQANLTTYETQKVNTTVDRLTNRANAIAFISLAVAVITVIISLPSQYATSTGAQFARINPKYLRIIPNEDVSFIIRIFILVSVCFILISWKRLNKIIEKYEIKEENEK